MIKLTKEEFEKIYENPYEVLSKQFIPNINYYYETSIFFISEKFYRFSYQYECNTKKLFFDEYIGYHVIPFKRTIVDWKVAEIYEKT